MSYLTNANGSSLESWLIVVIQSAIYSKKEKTYTHIIKLLCQPISFLT